MASNPYPYDDDRASDTFSAEPVGSPLNPEVMTPEAARVAGVPDMAFDTSSSGWTNWADADTFLKVQVALAKRARDERNRRADTLVSIATGDALMEAHQKQFELSSKIKELIEQIGAFAMPEKGGPTTEDLVGTMIAQLISKLTGQGDPAALIGLPYQLRDERYQQEVAMRKSEFDTKQEQIRLLLGDAMKEKSSLEEFVQQLERDRESRDFTLQRDEAGRKQRSIEQAQADIEKALGWLRDPELPDAEVDRIARWAKGRAEEAGVDPDILDTDISRSISHKQKAAIAKDVQSIKADLQKIWQQSGTALADKALQTNEYALNAITSIKARYPNMDKTLADALEQEVLSYVSLLGGLMPEKILSDRLKREQDWAKFQEKNRQWRESFDQKERHFNIRESRLDEQWWANYNRLFDFALANMQDKGAGGGIANLRIEYNKINDELRKIRAEKTHAEGRVRTSQGDEKKAWESALSGYNDQVKFYEGEQKRVKALLDAAPRPTPPQKMVRGETAPAAAKTTQPAAVDFSGIRFKNGRSHQEFLDTMARLKREGYTNEQIKAEMRKKGYVQVK